MLSGKLVLVGDQIIVDCGGVGYEVACSQYTRAALPAHGEPVQLRVFTQMRETAIALYGFIDDQERKLFDHLITVKNVGPSTAIAILSGASPREIASLIAADDVKGLTRIKGVGKKTAELILVELREKCELLLLSWNAEGGVRAVASSVGVPRTKPVPHRHPLLGEVMAALVNLGWRPAEADAVVGDLVVGDDSSIESLLRQALRSMPR